MGGVVIWFGIIFIRRRGGIDEQSEEAHSTDTELKNKLRLEIQSEYLQEREKLNQKEKQLLDSIDSLKSKLLLREENLESKLLKLELEKEKVDQTKSELLEIKHSLLEKKDQLEIQLKESKEVLLNKIEQISEYTKQEAYDALLRGTKEEMGQVLLNWQKKTLDYYREEANIKAKEIIALALQRCSSEVANEFTVTTIKLSNEEEKGKIIGKSGRNIQWLEKTLGVEIVIDDTPEIITLSGFSSIRRHIAKRTIELLLADGRIHPAMIEDMHEKAKSEIAQEIADAGQMAVDELGIIDFPAKLIRIIGRLKFRTSYGQNMLKHSIELARLAGIIAHDLNATFPTQCVPIDVDICIKAGLLHDIGKAVDEEIKTNSDHIELGERICDTFGLDWRIRKAISSHHNEKYDDKEHGLCIEAVIVDACDNLSGGRIGARKETAEAYYQRISDLEAIADSIDGVNKSWIMRGARELWVFFDTEKISASQMHTITKEIANRISTTLQYPGEIKIVGLWDNKIIEYAS